MTTLATTHIDGFEFFTKSPAAVQSPARSSAPTPGGGSIPSARRRVRVTAHDGSVWLRPASERARHEVAGRVVEAVVS